MTVVQSNNVMSFTNDDSACWKQRKKKESVMSWQSRESYFCGKESNSWLFFYRRWVGFD